MRKRNENYDSRYSNHVLCMNREFHLINSSSWGTTNADECTWQIYKGCTCYIIHGKTVSL